MADKVTVDFDLNAIGFQKGAQTVEQTATNLQGKLVSGLKGAIFATFSVEALKKFNEEFKTFVDDITISQKQTGASTTELQVWEKQIKKVGGSMEDVTKMVNKLAAARDKALENPTGGEAKAFAGLGIDRATLIASDGPELFKQIQENISKTGSAAGQMGNLMDLLGEKSVKNLAIFADSFSATEDKLKKTGKLIDENLIQKYKEFDKLSKEHTLADVAVGGNENKGKVVTTGMGLYDSLKGVSAWLIGNLVGAQVDTLTMGKTNLKGKYEGVAEDIFAGIRLATGDMRGELTPAQSKEMSDRIDQRKADRQGQLDRINKLRAENAEKALTDEEKLTKMYKEQEALVKRIEAAKADRSKRTEYLDLYEQYLRQVPKVKELKDKVDKENKKKTEEGDKKQSEQEKTVSEYMDKVKKGFFGNYTMNDSLVATGNFLGTGRQRLEDLTVRQTEILEDIRRALIEFLQQNPTAKGTTGFPDLS